MADYEKPEPVPGEREVGDALFSEPYVDTRTYRKEEVVVCKRYLG